MKKTSSNRALSISSNAKNLLPITGEESFGFHLTQLKEGLIFDCSLSMYPSRMDGYVGQQKQFDVVTRHHFGFVFSGEVVLSRPGLPDLGLTKGMYFSSPGGFKLSGDGQASVIGREGYRGMFNVGGPVEKSGRLCYIDNCSVSQLIPPARLGDPTFQLLVFPPGVEQTEHIHPTIRLGMVVWGHGQCRLPDGTRQDLNAGDVFYLEERFAHGFSTGSESMAVVAFHPDSDVGPTDEDHPMLSRTYVRKNQG